MISFENNASPNHCVKLGDFSLYTNLYKRMCAYKQKR